MNEQQLTSYLDWMNDGYDQWYHHDRRCRLRRQVALVVLSLTIAVAVNVVAFTLPMRYTSYVGGYGPDAVKTIDQMLHQ